LTFYSLLIPLFLFSFQISFWNSWCC